MYSDAHTTTVTQCAVHALQGNTQAAHLKSEIHTHTTHLRGHTHMYTQSSLSTTVALCVALCVALR